MGVEVLEKKRLVQSWGMLGEDLEVDPKTNTWRV